MISEESVGLNVESQVAVFEITGSPVIDYNNAAALFEKSANVAKEKVSSRNKKITLLLIFDIFIWCVGLALSVFKIYLWKTFQYAECEESIALWMGISGIVSVCFNVVSCPCFTSEKFGKVIASLAIVFHFSMLIWSTVMLNNMQDHVCPSLLYDTIWYLCLITWSMCGVLLISILLWHILRS
jgi:hypothetical protein